MRPVSKLLDRASESLCDAGCWLLAVLAALINVEVVLRYAAGKSTLIADEYGGYLFVWISMLGFAHALRSGQFIHVDMFFDRRGPRARAACDAFAALVGLLVAAVTAYACWLLLAGSLRFGTRSIQPSSTPLWTMQFALPFGMAWMCLLYLEALAKNLWRLAGGMK